MAARIIEPATGASTCAFGSHKWKPYTGIFIKKAIIDRAHHIVNDSTDLFAAHNSSTFGIDREELDTYMAIRLISNGREPNSV